MAKYKAQAKYDEENTKSYKIKLNKKTDSEILEWLDRRENKQGAIKEALLNQIKKEEQ